MLQKTAQEFKEDDKDQEKGENLVPSMEEDGYDGEGASNFFHCPSSSSLENISHYWSMLHCPWEK